MIDAREFAFRRSAATSYAPERRKRWAVYDADGVLLGTDGIESRAREWAADAGGTCERARRNVAPTALRTQAYLAAISADPGLSVQELAAAVGVEREGARATLHNLTTRRLVSAARVLTTTGELWLADYARHHGD